MIESSDFHDYVDSISLQLEIAARNVWLDDPEPGRCLQEIGGKVIGETPEGEELPIGAFNLFAVDVERAVKEDEAAESVFDTDARTWPYWALYDPASLEFIPQVTKSARRDEVWAPNLLIIDRLVISPQYRGKGLGLHTLAGLVREFSRGCGLVAMKPFPLQYEGGNSADDGSDEFRAMRLDLFRGSLEEARRKLVKYYSRAGFARVPRTDFMVLDPEKTLSQRQI